MNDKENYRELLGARLEAIHNAETSLKDFPSDEEILRWERLAAARLAERKAKKRKLISAAAVFLLAIAIGAAVIIGPPDVQAGGDGGAVIVDKTEQGGMEISHYKSIDDLPKNVKSNALLLDTEKLNWKIKTIKKMETKSILQLEIIYNDRETKEVVINQILSTNQINIQSYMVTTEKKEKIGKFDVYFSEDPNDNNWETCHFIYGSTYVYIYYNNDDRGLLLKEIEEVS